jgi:succinyl-CoA synthetase beta subunit
MRLYEHEGKELFKEYGIPVPESELLTRGSASLPFPVVLKAQVRSGDRMKAGGILFAETPEEFTRDACVLQALTIAGEPVEQVLIESKVSSRAEYYVSYSYDGAYDGPILALSAHGGSGIDDATIVPIDIRTGPDDSVLDDACNRADIPAGDREVLKQVLLDLWKLFFNESVLIAEINPLFATDTGLIAGDAKVELDDAILDPGTRPFVPMSGNIAVLASGGGASMLAMDALLNAGGDPANYTEYSGNPPAEVVAELTRKVLDRKGLTGCLVVGAAANFTDIEVTLSGFLDGLRSLPEKPTYPIVIRRDGPKRAEAFAMLEEARKNEGYDFHMYDADTSIVESAKIMVDLIHKPV